MDSSNSPIQSYSPALGDDAQAKRPLALVVTADDFGIGLQTSRGIILAHQRGPVTATSLMSITGDHAKASAPLLADAPDLDVGLHLMLTECGHKPLVAGPASGLVGRDGRFLSNGRLWTKAWLGRLNRQAVAEEIAAQAEMFRRLVGRAPVYVDGHHHAHQLPIIRGALLDVIARGDLPRASRITAEPPKMLRRIGGARTKRLAADFLGRRAANAFAAAGVRGNDFFFGMLASRDPWLAWPWKEYLNHLPAAGVIEWVVHPGLADDTLDGRDAYTAQRARELESLTSPQGIGMWDRFRPFLSRKSVLFRPPQTI